MSAAPSTFGLAIPYLFQLPGLKGLSGDLDLWMGFSACGKWYKEGGRGEFSDTFLAPFAFPSRMSFVVEEATPEAWSCCLEQLFLLARLMGGDAAYVPRGVPLPSDFGKHFRQCCPTGKPARSLVLQGCCETAVSKHFPLHAFFA